MQVLLDALWKWEYQIDGETLRLALYNAGASISISQHITEKFCHDYNHQVLKLYANLDDDNRKILITAIGATITPILELYQPKEKNNENTN